MSDTQERPVLQLADDLSLPPFWQEIWREAKARDAEPARQSCFNDGAHFVIGKLVEAAKDLVRLRKIDDAHDGPWEDQDAFNVFNRQISKAYHATSERWAEIVGAEVVDAMWQCPADDETSPTIAAPSPSKEVTPRHEVKFPATRMTLEQAKKEHDEWHPVYIEDCLWCRSEVALPSVRAALQASEEREQRLRAEIKEWRDDWDRVELDRWLAILDGGKP